MRITFLLSSLTLSGGVMLVIEYANGLAARGHVVTLVTPGGSIDPALLLTISPQIRVLECQAVLPRSRNPLALLRLIINMARITPPSDILVSTHTPTTVPTLLASVWGRKGRRAWLYMDYDEMFRGRGIERWLLHNAPRWFHNIWTISTPLQEQAAMRTNCPVVMTGGGLLHAALFYDQPRLPMPPGEIRLLYVGDARPRKGFHQFLEAAEQVASSIDGLKLIVVSKSPLQFETKIPVEFYRHPSDQQLADLYHSSALFVSASWGEGLGYPPLEAMACRTPVVLTDSDGVRDYARHGWNCLVVPPRNAVALAAAMQRMLQEPALAACCVENGLETAHRYRWEHVIARVETAAQRMLRDGPAQ
ncbi:MAG: glycosyltransferase family 4 protein [Caldilineaceae bacterium]|nr:glycosyltransferase family 4 protein [Caldilineaceae bacterium]